MKVERMLADKDFVGKAGERMHVVTNIQVAERVAGRNIANPIATVGAVQMMLDYLGEKRAATAIEDAVARLLRSKRLPSLGTDSGLGTNQIGDMVLEELEQTAKV